MPSKTQTPKELAQPMHPSDAAKLREDLQKAREIGRSKRPKKSAYELEKETEANRKQQILKQYKDELVDIISTYILNLRNNELGLCVGVLVDALYAIEKSGANLDSIVSTGTLKDRLQSLLQLETHRPFGLCVLSRAGLYEFK
ncbi:hypothetical protein [Myxosarcina sp. GI1(2024)]